MNLPMPKNRTELINLLSKNPILFVKFSEKYADDKEIVTIVTSKLPYMLSYASKELQDNEDILENIYQKDENNIFLPIFKNKLSFIERAINRNPSLLARFSNEIIENFMKTREEALYFLKNNPYLYKNLPTKYQEDEEFFKIKLDSGSITDLVDIPKKFHTIENQKKLCLQNYVFYISSASKEVKRDPELFIEILVKKFKHNQILTSELLRLYNSSEIEVFSNPMVIYTMLNISVIDDNNSVLYGVNKKMAAAFSKGRLKNTMYANYTDKDSFNYNAISSYTSEIIERIYDNYDLVSEIDKLDTNKLIKKHKI